VRQVGISRIATAGGAALLLLALAGPAAAAVDLGNLSADDMRALQRILETERTNAPKRLPSGLSVTVVQTQTAPRVCRIFRIGRQGQENQAVGCRIGAQRWALNASIDVAQAAPVDPSPDQPVVRPKVVAQSRPIQNAEDEGVEEAGAAPEAPARRSAQAPAPDAGRAPAETQVAALPRAPFRAPKPLARPDAPDVAAPTAAGPTQAPVPRARPTPGGAAPAATAAVPAVAPVVEIDPSLRVLTAPPAVPPPRLRPGSSRSAAVAAAPAEPPPAPAAPAAAVPAPAVEPAPAASLAPNPAPLNPVASAPAPKGPESLINVPPAAFASAPAVETLLPRTAAIPVAPAPFAVPPPRVRPEVAAAHPAQGLAPPAIRPVPPGAADVPLPRRRPG
jgi:hypothetical protein